MKIIPPETIWFGEDAVKYYRADLYEHMLDRVQTAQRRNVKLIDDLAHARQRIEDLTTNTT